MARHPRATAGDQSLARIETVDALRALYAAPQERALRKELGYLHAHHKAFVALAPFLVIATRGQDGLCDASPRGDEPGFVAVLDDHGLAIPDWPGNNRLDTLTNILTAPEVGLIFLVPGVHEVLRVNGRAELRDEEDLRARFSRHGRLPKLVIRVTVAQAYLHCAKAIMRAGLWNDEAKVDRAVLPSMNEMMVVQTGIGAGGETQEQMMERFRGILY